MLLAVSLSMSPAIGMPVQGESEWAEGVCHTLPRTGPMPSGEADPCGGASEPSLCVGLLSIRLLHGMAGESAIGICITNVAPLTDKTLVPAAYKAVGPQDRR